MLNLKRLLLFSISCAIAVGLYCFLFSKADPEFNNVYGGIFLSIGIVLFFILWAAAAYDDLPGFYLGSRLVRPNFKDWLVVVGHIILFGFVSCRDVFGHQMEAVGIIGGGLLMLCLLWDDNPLPAGRTDMRI
jgi:hypothetical protein